MRDILLSYVRTVVPVVVGFLISAGVLPDEMAAETTAVLYVVVTSTYYLAIRFLEAKVPWAGWLLGVPKAPSY